jgi:hypothetical protein
VTTWVSVTQVMFAAQILSTLGENSTSLIVITQVILIIFEFSSNNHGIPDKKLICLVPDA